MRPLATLTTDEIAALAKGPRPFVVLQPVGSVEPHGPHLPLETDTIISRAACDRAVELLAKDGIDAHIAPSVPYGVTDFARGFAGAVSVPAEILTAFLGAVVDGWLGAGARHVCLVNNHLEPAQDAAIRGVLVGRSSGAVSVACPLTRRWARTLSDEFKSGACHAGRYETSIVMAAALDLVQPSRSELEAVPISLSTGIKEGKMSFVEMGMTRAYAGAPAEASAAEGSEQLDKLAAMIAGEVREALDVP